MKKISFFLVVLILGCSGKERKCKDFRTGTFTFTKDIKGTKQTSTFVRTENLQIETYNGKKDTATVHWINDCEFVLRKKHPKNLTEQKAINITILSTEGNSYTFEYSFVGDVKKQRGTAIKQH